MNGGIYRGVCTQTQGLQIKVRVPQLLGDSELASWAVPCLPVLSSVDDHAQIAAHSHAVDVASTTSSTQSDHAHSVSVSSAAQSGDVSTGTTGPAGAHSHTVDPAPVTSSSAGLVAPRQHVQHQLPPKVGQGVWVMFEGGDVDHPVWMGVFGA